MALTYIRSSLLIVLTSLVLDGVQGRPRFERATTSNDTEFIEATTQFGPVRGRRFTDLDDSLDLDIFLGIRYAKPPVGDLRFSRPEFPTPWTDTKDALKHGAKCIQRIIPTDPVLENVPFAEDCLFLDIYAARYKNDLTKKVPVMMFIHGGGYYGGSGAKYNFTNVALKGVIVVSVSYRLDVFGFLSTQDDVIPGNFGLLDSILALDWIKSNIEEFGGNPDQITVFGGSAGASASSTLMLSPLTKGKIGGAIMQSGAISCPWSVYVSGMQYAVPLDVAKTLGSRLNCTLAQDSISQDLLTCLRATPAEVLVNESVYVQEQLYQGNMIFVPVVETTFGVIPDTPMNMLRNSSDLHHIPTMYGYMDEDGSYAIRDPDNDGVTLEEFKTTIRYIVTLLYPPEEHDSIYNKALTKYLPKDPSKLSKLELRTILVKAATGGSFVGCMIREARYFSKAKGGRQDGESDPQTYVFDFNHRPSYSYYPAWMGVSHADEKGFVLGLPVGPDPFMYPIHDSDDEMVRDFVVTTWTNFAKYRNPTPTAVQSVTWPQFKTDTGEKVMVIQTSPYIKDFDREVDVEVWASDGKDDGKGGGNTGYRCQANMRWWALSVLVAVVMRLRG